MGFLKCPNTQPQLPYKYDLCEGCFRQSQRLYLLHIYKSLQLMLLCKCKNAHPPNRQTGATISQHIVWLMVDSKKSRQCTFGAVSLSLEKCSIAKSYLVRLLFPILLPNIVVVHNPSELSLVSIQINRQVFHHIIFHSHKSKKSWHSKLLSRNKA